MGFSCARNSGPHPPPDLPLEGGGSERVPRALFLYRCTEQFKEPLMRLPRERFDYSAMVDRAPLALPDGARIAVWTIVNVEEWDIEGAMPRVVLPTPAGVSVIPDVPNWSWHEYGMRVGFWRLKAALDRHGIRATMAVNASVCLSYPRLAKAALDAGWEFMGHGYKQRALPLEQDQPAVIRKAIETIREFTGKAPRGW